MMLRHGSGGRQATRVLRMLARDVLSFGALIGWYVLLLALGLALAMTLFPPIPPAA